MKFNHLPPLIKGMIADILRPANAASLASTNKETYLEVQKSLGDKEKGYIEFTKKLMKDFKFDGTNNHIEYGTLDEKLLEWKNQEKKSYSTTIDKQKIEYTLYVDCKNGTIDDLHCNTDCDIPFELLINLKGMNILIQYADKLSNAVSHTLRYQMVCFFLGKCLSTYFYHYCLLINSSEKEALDAFCKQLLDKKVGFWNYALDDLDDEHQKYVSSMKFHDLIEKLQEHKDVLQLDRVPEGGSKSYVRYKNKQYVVRVGPKGGKFIMVNKKKIYM